MGAVGIAEVAAALPGRRPEGERSRWRWGKAVASAAEWETEAAGTTAEELQATAARTIAAPKARAAGRTTAVDPAEAALADTAPAEAAAPSTDHAEAYIAVAEGRRSRKIAEGDSAGILVAAERDTSTVAAGLARSRTASTRRREDLVAGEKGRRRERIVADSGNSAAEVVAAGTATVRSLS